MKIKDLFKTEEERREEEEREEIREGVITVVCLMLGSFILGRMSKVKTIRLRVMS